MAARPLAVLSIQSRVVYGHVGNSAATPALASLGIETWPIDTVTLSSHLGYPEARGSHHHPKPLAALLEGLSSIGAYEECDATLSGYLGESANAAVVVDAVARVRRANRNAIYVLDPVLGERGQGLYVEESVARATRSMLLPIADVIVPNQFELGWLAERPVDAIEDVLAVARGLVAKARREGRALSVVVTGVESDRGTRLNNLLIDGEGAWRCSIERRAMNAHGTGDYFAARLLGRRLLGASMSEAVAAATADTARVVAATVAAGRRELVLGEQNGAARIDAAITRIL
jgi:pyridoxine kinase